MLKCILRWLLDHTHATSARKFALNIRKVIDSFMLYLNHMLHSFKCPGGKTIWFKWRVIFVQTFGTPKRLHCLMVLGNFIVKSTKKIENAAKINAWNCQIISLHSFACDIKSIMKNSHIKGLELKSFYYHHHHWICSRRKKKKINPEASHENLLEILLRRINTNFTLDFDYRYRIF